MTAGQHKRLWLAKRKLEKKRKGFYTLISTEPPVEISAVSTAYDLLLCMYHHSKTAIKEEFIRRGASINSMIDMFDSGGWGYEVREGDIANLVS